MQHVTVHEEVDTLHGDTGAFVGHVAREAFTVDDGKLMHRHVIDLVVECRIERLCLSFKPTSDCHLVGDSCFSLIGQLINNIMSTLISGGTCLNTSSSDIYQGIGNTRTVVEAHVALQTTSVLTCANYRVGIGEVLSLAVGCRAYLILIGLQR